MNDALAAALAARPATNPHDPLSVQLRVRRKLVHAAMTTMVDGAAGESRGLHASEARDFDKAKAEVAVMDARIGQLEEQENAETLSAETRKMSGMFGIQSGLVGGYTNSETYHRGASSPSFFRDLLHSQRGDYEAIQRLHRNNAEVGMESRALGNTGGVGGSAGEFGPPAWLIDEFVKLARPGRVTADLFNRQALPVGVSSVNLPRVAAGTTAANQTTQNTALSQTDMTTTSLSSSISTIGGKQVVSQQLLDQSPVAFDRVVMEDLAADYARQLGVQVLTGSGTGGNLRGYLTPASTNIVTWTSTTPSAGGFYSQLAKLQGQIYATRYAAPDVVVMHPRRWAWLASYVDSTGRPLVVPTAGGYNSMASPESAIAAGHVGSILGMDVYTDPNIPINTGVGTNQDTVLMFPRSDVWLWESNLRAEVFQQTYADSVGVLFRCYNYAAMIPDRYLASLGQLSGSGLTTPVFTS